MANLFADIEPDRLARMKADAIKYYAPCPKHKLWHDLEVECFYCMMERTNG